MEPAVPAGKRIPIALLVLSMGIFAGGFIATRFYFAAGGSPWDVVAMRYGISGLILLPFVIRGGWLPELGLKRSLLLASVGGVAHGCLITAGLLSSSATHGSVITPGVALILGGFVAWAWLGEDMPIRKIFGLFLSACGLALMIVPDLVAQGGAAVARGDIFFFGAGIVWAGFTIFLRRWQIAPLKGAAIAATISLPYLIVYGLFLEPRIGDIAMSTTVIQGVFQGIVFNIIGIGTYAWCVGRLGASTAVAAVPLMPAWAMIMEYTFFQHNPGVHGLAGLVITIIGVTLAATVVAKGAPKDVPQTS